MVRTFFVFVFLVFPAVINFKKCAAVYLPHFEKTVLSEPKTIQEKYTALQIFADELKAENIISVSSKDFAKFMLCVFYAESSLNTKAHWNGQEGINQLTAETRVRLGMPANIRNDGFLQQLKYFKQYLIATNQGKKITRVYDLHILNFSPYKVGKDFLCVANRAKNLHYLDLDKDGNVTNVDMAIFIAKRCKENKFVNNIFKSLSV
jgi:hypothetical protein